MPWSQAGGLDAENNRWVERLEFDSVQIMELWRFAVTSYLWKANPEGLMQQSGSRRQVDPTPVEHHPADDQVAFFASRNKMPRLLPTRNQSFINRRGVRSKFAILRSM
jgi:hypothetical protein